MWPFKNEVPKEVGESVPEAVKPTEQIIDDILNERFVGPIGRQWVNWRIRSASEILLWSSHDSTVCLGIV